MGRGANQTAKSTGAPASVTARSPNVNPSASPSTSPAAAPIESPTTYLEWTDKYKAPEPIPDGEQPDYDGLLFEFPRPLSTEEQERACGIVCYWAKMPFVSDGTTENKWLSPSVFWIDADSLRARGKRERDVFNLLESLFRAGTPIRKNGTQRWEALRLEPEHVFLSHPGDTIPYIEPPPKVSTDAAGDPIGPMLGLGSASDLLKTRE